MMFKFNQQLTIANLLKKYGQSPNSAATKGGQPNNNNNKNNWGRRSSGNKDNNNGATTSAFATAQTDVARTIGILKSISHHDEASKTCVEILENLYGTVNIDVEMM